MIVFRSESLKQGAEGASLPSDTQRLCDGVLSPLGARIVYAHIFAGKKHNNLILIGVWHSLVVRLVRDQEAAGSNPVTPTKKKRAQKDSFLFGLNA